MFSRLLVSCGVVVGCCLSAAKWVFMSQSLQRRPFAVSLLLCVPGESRIQRTPRPREQVSGDLSATRRHAVSYRRRSAAGRAQSGGDPRDPVDQSGGRSGRIGGANARFRYKTQWQEVQAENLMCFPGAICPPFQEREEGTNCGYPKYLNMCGSYHPLVYKAGCIVACWDSKYASAV